MIDDLKVLLELVAGLPHFALWVIAAVLCYKVVFIGSVYGIIKLAIAKIYRIMVIPKTERKDIQYVLRDDVINNNVCGQLLTEIQRIRGITYRTGNISVAGGNKPDYRYSEGGVGGGSGQALDLNGQVGAIGGCGTPVGISHISQRDVDWLSEAISEKLARGSGQPQDTTIPDKQAIIQPYWELIQELKEAIKQQGTKITRYTERENELSTTGTERKQDEGSTHADQGLPRSDSGGN